MTNRFDPDRHHRRSIRLKGYDYTLAGAYFVTVVAYQRGCLFGEVVDGEMVLNEYGEIVQQEWEQTAIIRPNVELGTFIVMPNHLHGILIFADDDAHTVGATRRIAPTTKTTLQSGSLGAVMAQFKSIITKQINVLRNTPGIPVWQRNYYERIIRDEREMDRIHRYIESNPTMWANDNENPANL